MKQWKLSTFFEIRFKLHRIAKKIADWLEPETHYIDNENLAELIGYRYFGDETFDLVALTDIQGGINAKELPDELIIPPDFYSINKQIFKLEYEGLYRFYSLGCISEQRIVYQSDIYNLLSAIGHLWSYGNKDDTLSLKQLSDSLLQYKPTINCGTGAFLFHKIFKAYSFKPRVVLCLTLEQWNEYDNGHTMIEVYDTKLGYILYDPSFKCLFKYSSNGKYVSLKELVKIIQNNIDYEIIFCTHSKGNSLGEFKSSFYDFAFWSEHRFNSMDALKKWYQRVVQSCLIFGNERFFFTGNPHEKHRILQYDQEKLGYPIEYLEKTLFDKKFYFD